MDMKYNKLYIIGVAISLVVAWMVLLGQINTPASATGSTDTTTADYAQQSTGDSASTSDSNNESTIQTEPTNAP